MLKRSKSFHLKSEICKSDLIDKEEIMSSFETAFSNLDTDGNGTLCENEVVQAFFHLLISYQYTYTFIFILILPQYIKQPRARHCQVITQNA